MEKGNISSAQEAHVANDSMLDNTYVLLLLYFRK